MSKRITLGDNASPSGAGVVPRVDIFASKANNQLTERRRRHHGHECAWDVTNLGKDESELYAAQPTPKISAYRLPRRIPGRAFRRRRPWGNLVAAADTTDRGHCAR